MCDIVEAIPIGWQQIFDYTLIMETTKWWKLIIMGSDHGLWYGIAAFLGCICLETKPTIKHPVVAIHTLLYRYRVFRITVQGYHCCSLELQPDWEMALVRELKKSDVCYILDLASTGWQQIVTKVSINGPSNSLLFIFWRRAQALSSCAQLDSCTEISSWKVWDDSDSR